MDKLSYALGVSMAQNFKGSGIQSINADDFAEALRDVYEDKEKKMSYDEAKKVVQDFFTELGIATSLTELGIGSEDFDVMAARATRNGPVGHYEKLDKEKFIKVLKEAL